MSTYTPTVTPSMKPTSMKPGVRPSYWGYPPELGTSYSEDNQTFYCDACDSPFSSTSDASNCPHCGSDAISKVEDKEVVQASTESSDLCTCKTCNSKVLKPKNVVGHCVYCGSNFNMGDSIMTTALVKKEMEALAKTYRNRGEIALAEAIEKEVKELPEAEEAKANEEETKDGEQVQADLQSPIDKSIPTGTPEVDAIENAKEDKQIEEQANADEEVEKVVATAAKLLKYNTPTIIFPPKAGEKKYVIADATAIEDEEVVSNDEQVEEAVSNEEPEVLDQEAAEIASKVVAQKYGHAEVACVLDSNGKKGFVVKPKIVLAEDQFANETIAEGDDEEILSEDQFANETVAEGEDEEILSEDQFADETVAEEEDLSVTAAVNALLEGEDEVDSENEDETEEAVNALTFEDEEVQSETDEDLDEVSSENEEEVQSEDLGIFVPTGSDKEKVNASIRKALKNFKKGVVTAVAKGFIVHADTLEVQPDTEEADAEDLSNEELKALEDIKDEAKADSENLKDDISSPTVASNDEETQFEPIASNEEIEEATADDIELSEGENKVIGSYWNVFIKGKPVARIDLNAQKDKEALASYFKSSKYAVSLVNNMLTYGPRKVLNKVNAKFYANHKIDTKVIASYEDLAMKTATLRMRYADSLSTVIAALNKNLDLWTDCSGNELKASLFKSVLATLKQNFDIDLIGKKDEQSVMAHMCIAYAINEGFDEGASQFFSKVVNKATSLLDLTTAEYEGYKKIIGEAKTINPDVEEQVASEEEIEELASEGETVIDVNEQP